MLGRHQIENASLAVGLAKALEQKTRIRISESAVRQGIVDARWPARMETISDTPRVLVDGAQNADSAKRLLEGVERHFHFDQLALVIGVSSDKDIQGMLSWLAPRASFIVATQCQNPRAMKAEELAEAAGVFGKTIFLEKDSVEALEKAKSLVGPEGLVLVTGSLFLAAEIKGIYA